jgi:tetratricopeptide (TPR) repeat protein
MIATSPRAAAASRVSLVQLSRELVSLDEIEAELRQRPDRRREARLRLLASEACRRLGALPEAADHLAAILIGQPEHLEANRRLTRLLCEIGDASGALRCWRRACASTGDEAAATLADLGLALLAAGREDEALTAFTRALAHDPQSAAAHCGLGLVQYAHERWRDAVAAFRAAALLAPDSAVAAFNLGLALERLGEQHEARRALLRAAALEPRDEDIQSVLEPLLVRQSITPHLEQARDPGAAFRGELGSFKLFDLLEFLRVQQKTGSLVLSAPAGIGILRLERGLVIGGSAPRLRGFGEVLLRRGLITRDQLGGARSSERDATALAAALLRERQVDEGPLSEVLFRMTLHIVSQLQQWQQGVFSFHPAPDTGFPIAFDIQQLALELARLEDERQR